MKHLPILLLFALFGAACENMKKDFDPGVKETAPKLVVHASLDDADSLFTLHITETSPLSGTRVESFQPFDGKQVGISLYEDDRLLLALDNPTPNGLSIFVQQKVSSVAAARTYRLRVAVDSFETVESTVVAPAALTLAECSIDTSQWLLKNSTWTVDDGRFDAGYGLFDLAHYHPAKFGIVDISTDKCYYNVEVKYTVLDSVGRVAAQGQAHVATGNQLLVQDNPYIEDEGMINTNTEPVTMLFYQMVFSNFLFANKTCKEEFWVPAFFDTSKEDLLNMGYTGDRIERIEAVATVKVRRLTTELFQYYRTGVQQGWSGDEISLFAGEPVSVPSNISNGYGNFSVSTAVQQELYRRRVWRVKQQYY